MQTMRLTLAALLSSAALTLGVAGAASACSCAMASTGAHARSAEVVVTGTLVDVQDPPRGQIMSSGDPTTYTVDVLRTFKGEPASRIEFTSAMSGASCGLEGMQVHRDYLFFLDDSGAGLTASLCGGTRPASAALEREVTAATVPLAAPAPRTSPPSGGTQGSSTTSARQSAGSGWLPAAGGAAATVAALGLWWWRRASGHPSRTRARLTPSRALTRT